uniref:Uncharacterized protein n=1 Tax=Clytia hemisphaerica TaxID=252671 RepID=A0A7M5U184_9CNID
MMLYTLQSIFVIFSWNIGYGFACQKILGVPRNNHGIKPILLVDEETEITKGKLIAIVPVLSPEWSVAFNIRLTQAAGSVHRNVFRMAEIDDNSFTHGTRIPAVFILEDTSDLSIHSSVNAHPHKTFTIPNLLMNQTYHVFIKQRYVSGGDYKYSIIFDGVEVFSQINTIARQFYNVKVYNSDRWYQAAFGYISKFELTNFL